MIVRISGEGQFSIGDAATAELNRLDSELDMMSAGSDVERELSRLKGEITAGAPKQLEGGANGNSQAAPQSQDQGQGTQYAPPPPEQAQPTQQAQPAGIPASDLPAEPQDREGS